jgi:hypothetical protein
MEVTEVHWPMVIPAHADFAVTSSQPLKIASPHSLQIHALTPVHIRSEVELKIMPAGPLTSGFARGWRKLPNELKLDVLRHNLVFPTSIWPANINAVVKRELLPYLIMTPDIAEVAQAVFYRENQFIMQLSSSTSDSSSSSILAIPPVPMRSFICRLTLLTRLTNLDWHIMRSIYGGPRAGFINLVHIEVRCLSWEVAMHLGELEIAGWKGKIVLPTKAVEERFLLSRGEPLEMPFSGVVTFDRSGLQLRGDRKDDELRVNWLRKVEEVVTKCIQFRGA